MMVRPSWRLLALLVLAVASPSLAQPVSNWAAPLFWSPAAARTEQGVEGRASVEAGTAAASPVREETAAATPLAFVALPPCRLVDTRDASYPAGYGPPSIAVGVTRDFVFTGRCGIPATAQAVSSNLTVTNNTSNGNIQQWPAGSAPPSPPVSSLNYPGGKNVANAAVVVLGSGGAATFFAPVLLSGTDLLIDVNGYYAPEGIVNSLNTLSGDVTLAGGTNISITPAGQTLTINNTAPAGVSSVSGDGTFLSSSGGLTPTISLSGVVDIAHGGTGSGTQNFVDLFNAQTVAGVKTLSDGLTAGPAPSNPLPSGVASFSNGIIVGDVPASAPPKGSIAVGAANAVASAFDGTTGLFLWTSSSITPTSFIICTYQVVIPPANAISVLGQVVGAAAIQGTPGANFACVAFN